MELKPDCVCLLPLKSVKSSYSDLIAVPIEGFQAV
jgi:hypothetical protein